jgi:deoxyribodipyrimidine photolyase-related protein
MAHKTCRNLCVVLGDQLSLSLSALQDFDPKQDHILMCEVWDEATYVHHHKKKIAFLFSAMRHFAQSLKDKGFAVRYVTLDDPKNTHSFKGEVERAVKDLGPQRIICTMAGEYRVDQDMRSWASAFSYPVDIRDDDRFLCRINEFKKWAADKKTLRMEFFYREMRKKFKILVTKDLEPEGGAWNFDAENRKKLPENIVPPKPVMFEPDPITREVMDLVSEKFSSHFGDLEPFYFAVTNDQAQQILQEFIRKRLKNFGDYQDAMKEGEPWMFHSHISFYLNCGLLDPLHVIQEAEKAYRKGGVPLNAVEGFIRQILGWREYIRGIYWLKMPDYAEANFLEADRPLPDFYWTAKTKMNCLKQCVTETKQNAYAHHIQRLMVLGNFALLAGIDPRFVNEWYLIVYADAYEWVEMPNVSGMILFADGGFLASKPYAASGAYINKMSDYCQNCAYKVQEKAGPSACPFNYLYWDFLMRNEPVLKNNQRLSMVYSTLRKMTDERKKEIAKDAKYFFDHINQF